MDAIKKSLAMATIRILRPLIRVLLRHEISHREFSEFAKQAYIDVAYKHFSIPNRKSTYSRIAVLTGLSRKEVTRLVTKSDEVPPSLKRSLNRASAIIAAWLQDAEFVDKDKQPKVLPLRGEQGSFEQLVVRYGGNVTTGSVLDELERIDAIQRPTPDTVQLCSKGYIPLKDLSKQIDITAMSATDLLNTAVHNMEADETDARFQRQVVYYQVPESLAEKFKQYSDEKSMQLLLDYNQWLASHLKQCSKEKDVASKRLGVGIYYFENDNFENDTRTGE